MDGTGLLLEPFVSRLPVRCEVQILRYPVDRLLSYAELEVLVVDQWPRDCPVTLIAESFSGPIALQLSQRPDLQLRAVVLVCSSSYRPLGWFGVLLSCLPLELILRASLPSWVVRAFLLNQTSTDEMVSLVKRAIASVKPRVLADRLRQALRSKYCASEVKSVCRVAPFVAERDICYQ